MRAENIQPHFSFEIWLIEKWEHSVGIIRFKLSIQILFLVHVNEAHATTTIVVVLVLVPYSNLVASLFEVFALDVHKAIVSFLFPALYGFLVH